jgi:hypothetical protein
MGVSFACVDSKLRRVAGVERAISTRSRGPIVQDPRPAAFPSRDSSVCCHECVLGSEFRFLLLLLKSSAAAAIRAADA